MTKRISTPNKFLACLILTFSTLPVWAQEGSFEIELRANALLADGVPANDIIGFGIGGRYKLKDDWYVSGAIETYDFDFERPIEVVGLQQDPAVKAIDATNSMTVVSAGIGRNHQFRSEKFDWFWELGLGAGFPDVANASGPLATGGNFTVVTDANTEFHLQSKLGASYNFATNWSLNFVARLEHHFIDYKVTETGSGATGSISSQTPVGAHIGLSYSF